MLTSLFRRLILALVRLFYPRIGIEGHENLPTSGPVIFVLNHPNGLLDPLLLMLTLGRRVSFLAKNTFFNNPIGRLMMRAFDALPIYRQRDSIGDDTRAKNDATFARCREMLRQGIALALFPEGVTHSEPRLLTLKSGSARIALGAEAEADWQMGLQIVPVGLWYEDKRIFRSSVLLIIGKPFTITTHQATFERDQEAAVKDLTARTERHLGSVVFQAGNADLLRGLPLLVEWTINHLKMRRQAAQAALSDAYTRFAAAAPQQMAELAAQAQRYRRTLQMLGISDPWTPHLPLARRARFFTTGTLLLLSLPLALLGALISYPMYRSGGVLAERLTNEDEVLGTMKLICGMVFVPLGWILSSVAVGMWLGALWGWMVFALAPMLGYLALRWGELGREFRQATSATWLRVFERSLVEQLNQRRNALSSRIVTTVLELNDHEPVALPNA